MLSNSFKKMKDKLFSVMILIAVVTSLMAISANAQDVYGNLDLLILTNNEIPAEGAIARAIDPDLADTTTAFANEAGIAHFEDLYVYTISQINTQQNNENTGLFGLVKIYNLKGVLVDVVDAQNGSVLWHGDKINPPGVYIAIDEQNHTLKFLYTKQASRIGSMLKTGAAYQQKSLTKNTDSDTTKTYVLEADGRLLEYNPFDITSCNFELFEGENEHTFSPAAVPDAPAMGQIELLVGGEPCMDSSVVKMVRPGNTDTTFLYTTNGIAEFDENDNIRSHPFGNYTREYKTFVFGSGFLPDTFTVYINVGPYNDFTFTPQGVPPANGAVIMWNGTTPTSNVEVNIWKLLNPTDTATYITNAAGKIWYDNLPVNGPTQYVFQSYKNDGVNPVLVSVDTSTLVSGSNDLLNFYLEEIPQLFRVEGTVHEFYNQLQIPQSAGVMIRDKATQAVIDSAAINPETGLYSLANIPAGLVGEMVLVSPDTSMWFHRINDYNTPAIVQSLDDTLIADQNTLQVPRQFIIPQTENDPAPEMVGVIAEHLRQMVGTSQRNGEDIARQEGRIYLTNFGTPADSAYFFAAEKAIDSLFFGGQGSHLILVPNHINISPYHQLNYDINVGFPNQLGHNVTRGGGNITSTIRSSATTGGYIIGGQINITGGMLDLLSAIKELHGRLFDFGDTGFESFMNNGNPSNPTWEDRAYSQAIRTNHQAVVMTGQDIFFLDGLSTTLQTSSPEKNNPSKTFYCQPEQFIQHNE